LTDPNPVNINIQTQQYGYFEVNQPIAHLFHHDLVSMGGWSAHGTGKRRHVPYLIKKIVTLGAMCLLI